jgi:ribosomal protein S18 acetylase RimI-like enzyme
MIARDTNLELKLDPACTTAVRALEHDPFYRSICAGHERDGFRRRAVWLLPQAAEVDSQAARKKRAFLDATLDRKGCANYYQIIDYMHSRTTAVVGADAWYLSILAVDPAVQGQGFGRKLLEPTLAEADSVSATCYLETFSPRTIGFYHGLGFSTQARFSEPTTGANYAVMVRRPTRVERKP